MRTRSRSNGLRFSSIVNSFCLMLVCGLLATLSTHHICQIATFRVQLTTKQKQKAQLSQGGRAMLCVCL